MPLHVKMSVRLAHPNRPFPLRFDSIVDNSLLEILETDPWTQVKKQNGRLASAKRAPIFAFTSRSQIQT